MGLRAEPRLRDIRSGSVRRHRLRGDGAGAAGAGDRRHARADRQAFRRQPHHDASEAGRPDRRLRRNGSQPHRAGGRAARTRRHAPGQGVGCLPRLLRAGPAAGPQAGPGRRRCAYCRGRGGGRAYRPRRDCGTGSGNPAADSRCPDFRGRGYRTGRGDSGLSGNGRLGLPDRHAVRRRRGVDRASALQAGVSARRGARCRAFATGGSALSGRSGARARQRCLAPLRRIPA